MRTLAETAARLLLQEYQMEHPTWTDDQTPVDDLAAWLNLDIATFHPEDYPEGTHGFMDPDEEENLIWLRRDLPETLRRFTLAHELGHALLHCHNGNGLRALLQRHTEATPLQQLWQETGAPSSSDPCSATDVQEDMMGILDEEQFQEALGIGMTYNPRSQREIAANIFASELLLPLERIRARYLDNNFPPQELAARFGVSNAALLNRLAGFLKPITLQNAPLVESSASSDGVTPPPPRKAYDEFQQAAITATPPALIVAGPGSGKTSTLIGRIEYVIRTLNVPAQQILALTFSRKAAQEMEDRLRQVLTDTGRALPQVSTFHAFCADLLRQYPEEVGLRPDFALIDDAEGYFLLRQQSNAMRLRYYQNLQAPAYYFPDMLKAISRAKDELVSPHEYAELAQRMRAEASSEKMLEDAEKALEIAHVYELYQQELQRRGDSDFGGLLTLTLQLFQQRPDILQEQQQKYAHILVDEFQDVNRASGVLLRMLAGTAQNVWVVGDANQAIYGFRGASSSNISQFEQHFPGAGILPLSRNYRSRSDLVALAEAFRCAQLEPGQEQGKNQPIRVATQPDAYITLACASDEACELSGIIQDIHTRHQNGAAYKDMAVLCRTRAQTRRISRVLAAAEIPVIERGSTLEQEHIKDVLSLLLLLVDRSGMGLLRAARQSEHPLSQQDIEALLLAAREPNLSPRQLILEADAPLSMSNTGRRSLIRLTQILQVLQHSPDVWTLLAHYLFLESLHIRELLTPAPTAKPVTHLADYDMLLQLARHYDQQQARHLQRTTHTDEQESEAPALFARIKGFLEYLNLLVLLRQDGSNRANNDENEERKDILRVMTVHASKGLEFPIVYMPELAQQRFPQRRQANPVEAQVALLTPEREDKLAHESSEAYLFYVGVTRARDALVLSYSERYGKKAYKRSPFLDALEAGLPAARITKLSWTVQSTPAQALVAQQDAPVTLSSQPSESFIAAMRSPTLSSSAIEAYQRCPRQYAYSTIYHFRGETEGYSLFWQATQKTLEELRSHASSAQQAGNEDTSMPTEEEIRNLYTQHWQALGGPNALFSPMYEEHGHEVVVALRRQLTLQEHTDWHLRPSYTVDVAGKTVHVTVDRVEESSLSQVPTRFVRARFKKGSKEKPEAEVREFLYTLAYRQQHPGQPVELHSHNLSSGETVPVTMTAKKEQTLYDNVEQALKGLTENQYPAQPEKPFRCPLCPFFLICPA